MIREATVDSPPRSESAVLAALSKFFSPQNRCIQIRKPPAIRKTIGRDVENTHYDGLRHVDVAFGCSPVH